MTACMYCGSPAEQRLDGDEESGVCPGCWELLKDPGTALPLIRGHLTSSLRGKIPEDRLKASVDAFVSRLSASMGVRPRPTRG